MVQFSPLASDLKTLVSAQATPSTYSSVSPWLTPLIYQLSRHVLLPFYFRQIEIVGQEHLPLSGPVVLAPTHRSRWDAFMVPYAAGRDTTGRDLRFLVSEDEMRGIQGWFIRQLGGFPVDTKRPTIASLRHGVELLQAGEVLVIFPEGNIFRERRIQPLKPGLARLAIQAEGGRPGLGIKIVPIVIEYNQPIPRWRCDVSVQIGTPLEVIHYTAESAKQAARRLTADLETALKSLASYEATNPLTSPANLTL
jgi:1-acyl-sn-glycerol-3-phosphate acyltransferase